MKPKSDLSEAVQYLALRRQIDDRWVRRAILRNRFKALLCRACEAAVNTLRRARAL